LAACTAALSELLVGAQAVNGLADHKMGARGRAADPAFAQLLAALQRILASGAVGLYTDPATSVPPYSGNEGRSSHVSDRAAPKGADNQCNVEFEV